MRLAASTVAACSLAGVLGLGGAALLVGQFRATPVLTPATPVPVPSASPSSVVPTESDTAPPASDAVVAPSGAASPGEPAAPTVAASPGVPAVDVSALVGDIIERTNMFRSAYSSPLVSQDPDLMRAAQEWANVMLENDTYQHSSDERLMEILADGGFGAVGENLHAPERQCAAAPACDHSFANPTSGTLMVDWIRSPSHRANLLDARWDRIGVGVACAPDGRVWTAVLYASSTPTTPDPITPVGAPAAEPPLQDDGFTCSGEYRGVNPKWLHPVSVP